MRGLVSWLLAVVGPAIVAVAPSQSHAANLNILVSFCALANCADGSQPLARLIIDAKGNLFGTTSSGGANNRGMDLRSSRPPMAEAATRISEISIIPASPATPAPLQP